MYHPLYSLRSFAKNQIIIVQHAPYGAIGLTQIVSTHWRQSCPGNLYDEKILILTAVHISYRPHYKICRQLVESRCPIKC